MRSSTCFWADIRDVLESFTKTQNADANGSRCGCHIQDSNLNSPCESENGQAGEWTEAGGTAEIDNVRRLPNRELPLGIVLDACPHMLEIIGSPNQALARLSGRGGDGSADAGHQSERLEGCGRRPGRSAGRDYTGCDLSARSRSTMPAATCAV